MYLSANQHFPFQNILETAMSVAPPACSGNPSANAAT